MAENFQVRDVFNPGAVQKMAQRIKSAWGDFAAEQFIADINPKLPTLTYSQRSVLITKMLEKYLPDDFPAAVKHLLAAQLPPFNSEELKNTADRFITITNTAFISRNGLNHFDLSMRALYEMTKRMTAEFDIRIFIEKYPEKTLSVLKKWANDENAHVRRLASEGSRPLLPWGKRLAIIQENPHLTLDILELLKNDTSEYVRRSVANHLNDHAKNHPDLIVETLRRWKEKYPEKNMEKLIKHATRTLVKKGHAGALELNGFKKGAAVIIDNFKHDNEVKIGDEINFSFDIISTAKKEQPIVIDYIIYFRKANGSASSKVFKLTTKKIAANEIISVKKKHSFRIITTRTYYAGIHKLGIQINGEEKIFSQFILSE